jgi:hypothetical protein
MNRDDYIPELMDIQRLSLIKCGVPWLFFPTAYLVSLPIEDTLCVSALASPICPPPTFYDNLGPGDD